jgi:hypothetical protein
MWFPQMLTPDHKEQRLHACAYLLGWYEIMGDILGSIITRDYKA